MLTLAEELLLLALDDDKGTFARLPDDALAFALACAVLMDLSLRLKIDSDLEQLTTVDAEPIGDDILDPVLAAIARSKVTYHPRRWIAVLSRESPEIRARALRRLVDHGILRCEDRKLLWVLGQRRYPSTDGRESAEVEQRLRAILFGDAFPEPHDVMLIALVDACRLTDKILSGAELRSARVRIDQVSRMDLFAHALVDSLRDVRVLGQWVGSPREDLWSEPSET